MKVLFMIVGAILAVGALVLYAFPTQLLFADESETNEEQALNQKNVGSGESINSNCAENSIDSGFTDVNCRSVDSGEEYGDVVDDLAATTSAIPSIPSTQ